MHQSTPNSPLPTPRHRTTAAAHRSQATSSERYSVRDRINLFERLNESQPSQSQSQSLLFVDNGESPHQSQPEAATTEHSGGRLSTSPAFYVTDSLALGQNRWQPFQELHAPTVSSPTMSRSTPGGKHRPTMRLIRDLDGIGRTRDKLRSASEPMIANANGPKEAKEAEEDGPASGRSFENLKFMPLQKRLDSLLVQSKQNQQLVAPTIALNITLNCA